MTFLKIMNRIRWFLFDFAWEDVFFTGKKIGIDYFYRINMDSFNNFKYR